MAVPSTYLRANDLGYEYEVRGKEPPFELVKEDLEVVFAAIGKIFDDLTEERREEINTELFADYEKAIAEGH